MSVFARMRDWFRVPALDRATQREAASVKERRDLARLSQSDAPGFLGGIVTPDRTPKAGGSSGNHARGTLDDLPNRPRRAGRGGARHD